MNNLSKLLSLTFISSMLIACETVNPPEYQSQLNRTMHFHQSYYVYEVKDWRPGGSSGNYLTHAVYSGVGVKMPSLNDYLQNKNKWYEWHSNLDLRYRILGVANSSTTYKVNNVHIGYENAYEMITITNGALRGTQIRIEGSGFGTHGGNTFGKTIDFSY